MSEDRAALDAKARNALPDSAFAYIDEKGERHFPIHDKEHVQKALQLGPRSPMWGKAKVKVLAAAKKHGVHPGSGGRSLEAMYPEVRTIQSAPEVRSAEGEPTTIHGYAAVFDKTSRRLGNFVEQVTPQAFDEALRSLSEEHVNVVCRYNHKDDMVLGTSHAGTLRLAVDQHGLKYEVDPPRHRGDVMELVERGDVRYSSFAFRVNTPGEDDSWGESEFGLPMRRLHRVELVDVAPVMDPAYRDTNAMARSLAGAVESLASWVDADPSEVRSVLEAGQASKFFRITRRTGTQVIPKPDVPLGEARMLDDPAVALRHSTVEETPVLGDSEVPEDERELRTEEEIRAAVKPRTTDQLCMRYHHGEPCVRPVGHGPFSGTTVDADNPNHHRGLCWGRHDGMPCNQHIDHDGPHTPVTVASRDGEEAVPEPENRNLSIAEAMRQMSEREKTFTQLPED